MLNLIFNVRPRYTPGSPAAVDEATARRVAEEERGAILHSLDGTYGEEERARAEKLGLGPAAGPDGVRRSIAEETVEHTGHWMVRDMLTGEIYERDFPNTKRRNVRCMRCFAAREHKNNGGW